MTLASFGQRLRALRSEKELSQTELGRVLNLAKQTISSYETEASAPDYDTLRRIADYFSVSTDYLLGRVDDPAVPKRVSTEAIHREKGYDDELSEEAQNFLADVRRLVRERFPKKE